MKRFWLAVLSIMVLTGIVSIALPQKTHADGSKTTVTVKLNPDRNDATVKLHRIGSYMSQNDYTLKRSGSSYTGTVANQAPRTDAGVTTGECGGTDEFNITVTVKNSPVGTGTVCIGSGAINDAPAKVTAIVDVQGATAAAGSLTGKISVKDPNNKDESRNPCGSSTVTLTNQADASKTYTYTIPVGGDCNSDGKYTFANIPKGTYTLTSSGKYNATGYNNLGYSFTKKDLVINNGANSFNIAATGDKAPDAKGDDDEEASDCGGDNFNWVICPLTALLQKMSGTLDDFITSELTIDRGNVFGTNDKSQAYYTAWNTFRVIATAILVIAGLVMVASEALGFELLDAYTIRKTLPRLLVAVIGISLSWPILSFVIGFFNVLGNGIQQLMYAPFSHLPNHSQLTGGLSNYFAIGAVALAIKTGFGGVLWPILAAGLLTLVIAFLIIVIRQIAVTLLVILAPVAIAAYALPNTKKLWDLWQQNFVGLMVMFPIVMMLIAAGKIFSAVAGTGSAVQQLIGLISYFVGYFLILFAFRAATGLISTLTGMVNDKSKGAFDRLKNKRNENMAHASEHLGRQTIARRANLNSTLKSKGRVGQLAARAVGGYNIEAKASARNASVKKEIEDQIATGDDTEIRALTARKAADGKYYSLAGKQVDEGSVRRAKSRWGHDVYAQQAALSYEMRKAMTDDEVQSVAAGYKDVADGWGMTDRQRGGAWIGSAFENAGTHLEYKYTSPDTGRMDAKGAKGYATELYEKKGSYQMSQFTANSFQKMKEGYNLAVQSGDTDTARKYQAVAETFMQRGGFNAPGLAPTGTDGELQPTAAVGAGSREYVQSNSQGSGHVAEAVRNFAVHVGVYRNLPAPRTTSDKPYVDHAGEAAGPARPEPTNDLQN